MLGPQAINAIQTLRGEFGLGLKEARDLYERHGNVEAARASLSAGKPIETAKDRIAKLEAALKKCLGVLAGEDLSKQALIDALQVGRDALK